MIDYYLTYSPNDTTTILHGFKLKIGLPKFQNSIVSWLVSVLLPNFSAVNTNYNCFSQGILVKLQI